MIRFQCPTCQSTLECSEERAGDKIACLKCRQRILIPSPMRNATVLGTLLPPKSVRQPPVQQRDAPAAESADVPIEDCLLCNAALSVPPEQTGRWIECPNCGEGFAAAAKEPSPPPHVQGHSNSSAGAARRDRPKTRLSTERCYDCGELIPEGDSCRRIVTVSYSHTSGSYGSGTQRGSYGGSSSTTAKVSLCPECDAERDAYQRTVIRAFAIIGGIAALVLVIVAVVILAAATSSDERWKDGRAPAGGPPPQKREGKGR
jgi:DNA-directed RNA polymerase subunit M/transcription elongation factor TFIIS